MPVLRACHDITIAWECSQHGSLATTRLITTVRWLLHTRPRAGSLLLLAETAAAFCGCRCLCSVSGTTAMSRISTILLCFTPSLFYHHRRRNHSHHWCQQKLRLKDDRDCFSTRCGKSHSTFLLFRLLLPSAEAATAESMATAVSDILQSI
jgi:hypothetical protein